MKTAGVEQGTTKVVGVSNDGTATVGDSKFLLSADYARDGNDLQLTGDDGSQVVVMDYFSHSVPPALLSIDGKMVSGHAATLLAGPQAPGQYAQAGSPALGTPIGQVETLEGTAFAQRLDGTNVELQVGSHVFKGDVLKAGGNSTVGITFADETVFSLSNNATMVLNDMVYNAGGQSNSMLFNLINGTASFITGAVAKSGDMQVDTPVAVMAIRGTTVVSDCAIGQGCEFYAAEGQYNLLHKVSKTVIGTVSDANKVVRLDSANSTPSVVDLPDNRVESIQSLLQDLQSAVGSRDGRLEQGQDAVSYFKTGSNNFPTEGFIESIAGFFKSTITKLLGEEQIEAAVEDDADQLEQIFQPQLRTQTDEDSSIIVRVITEDDVLGLGAMASVIGVQITTGLGQAQPSDDGTAVIYDPGEAYNGLAVGESETVQLSILIQLGDGSTVTEKAKVTVLGVNDPPNANADVASGSEDVVTVIHVLDNDTDPDVSDELSVVSAGVTNGLGSASVSGDGKSVIYNPGTAYTSLAVGETALVTIAYTIADGSGAQSSASIQVTVTGANDGPTANADTATTSEDSSVVISVLDNDTDPDVSDELSVVSAGVTNGLGSASVSGDGKSVIYNPGTAYTSLAVGETALVTIAYTIADGSGAQSSASIQVTVTGANDGPTANADTATTSEDSSVVISVLDNDTDPDVSDELSVVSAGVTNGLGSASVSGDGKSVIYNPGTAYTSLAVGETALVTIAYTIADGSGAQSSASIQVTVTGANDGPTANADTATTSEDSSVVISVLDNDTDPDVSDELSVVSAGVTNGLGSASVSGDGKSVIYNPGTAYTSLAVGETALVTIAYTIADGSGAQSSASIQVTVTGANDGPTANADTATTSEDSSVVISVLDNDTDPDVSDELSVVSAGVTNGLGSASVSGDGKSVIYNPGTAYTSLAVGETALVTIAYTIADGSGAQSSASIQVTVTGANDGPTANADTATTSEDSSVVISVLDNDTDPDVSDELSVVSAGVTNGLGSASVSGDGKSVIYNPGTAYTSLAVGETALVTIAYTIADGSGAQSSASIQVTVTGANDGPTANADTATTSEDSSVVISVLDNDTDPDVSDELSVVSADVTNGLGSASVSGDGKSVIYDPGTAYTSLAVGETALVTIAYTIADGSGAQSSASIQVTVTGANDGPTANADTATTSEDSSVVISVLDNDTDPDASDELNILSASVAAGMGAVLVSADRKSLIFDPADDFQYLPQDQSATVQISYQVEDGNGGVATGFVTVTVTGLNDTALIGGEQTGRVTEREEENTTEGQLTITDVDLGEAAFQASTTVGIYGTLSINAAGLWIFTLDNSDPDTISLNFDQSAEDIFIVSSIDGTTAQITITVNGAGFDFEYDNFGGNSGSSQFKSIDSGNLEAADVSLIITPMPLLLDSGGKNTVNATQTDLGIGTGQKISASEGVRMEIVLGAQAPSQNAIDDLTFDAHVAVQVFKTGIVQVQGEAGQTATVQIRLVYADDDSNFDTANDTGDVVVPISPSDVTVTSSSAFVQSFAIGDTVVITGLQQGDILTVNSSTVFNRVEIENGSNEINPITGSAFGGEDFEVGTLGFNMPDELLLIGDSGNNNLVGAESNDTLDGRGGMDTLEGGAGVDIFVLGEELSTGALADIFVDYEVGVDVVDVTELLDLAPGDFTESAVQEYVRYISSSDNDADDPAGNVGDIYVDLDGAGSGVDFVLAAHLTGAPDNVIFRVDDGSEIGYVTII